MRAPKPGACVPFADPQKTGFNAELFWRPEAFARILRAYVRTSGEPGFGSVITLGDLQCQRAILKAADGEQHMLLRDERHIVQVLCRGADLRTDPFSIELVVDQFPEVEGRLRLLKVMANIYRQRRIGGGRAEWTVEATRHRDALAALDRRMEGWSYRQIAIFLYGQEAVHRDWTSPDQSMKNRVIRSVKRGVRMRDGGYRGLLE